MKKRILAALLAVILLISALCACNTKETDGSLDASKTETDTDPTSSEENTENSVFFILFLNLQASLCLIFQPEKSPCTCILSYFEQTYQASVLATPQAFFA